MRLRTPSVLLFQFQGRLTLLLKSFVSSLFTNHWQSSVTIHRLWPQLTLIQNWKIIPSVNIYQRSMQQLSWSCWRGGAQTQALSERWRLPPYKSLFPQHFPPFFSQKKTYVVLHVTALTHLEAFKSVRMPKNNCFEKARGLFLKNLPWVTPQRREALSGGGVPELDIVVPAAAGYCWPTWAPCYTGDAAFTMRWVSTRRNSGQGRKIDGEKKSHRSECPL